MITLDVVSPILIRCLFLAESLWSKNGIRACYLHVFHSSKWISAEHFNNSYHIMLGTIYSMPHTLADYSDGKICLNLNAEQHLGKDIFMYHDLERFLIALSHTCCGRFPTTEISLNVTIEKKEYILSNGRELKECPNCKKSLTEVSGNRFDRCLD